MLFNDQEEKRLLGPRRDLAKSLFVGALPFPRFLLFLTLLVLGWCSVGARLVRCGCALGALWVLRVQ